MKNSTDVFSHIANEAHCAYPLEWLDLLITFTLDPAKNDLDLITREQAQAICDRMPAEEARLLMAIKKQMFAVAEESSTRLITRRYHSALIILLDCCLANSAGNTAANPLLQMVFGSLISCIDSILSYLESHYYRYMPADLRVPATYLSVTRRELREKIGRLKAEAAASGVLQPLKDIVFKNLLRFADASQLRHEITFRTVLYNKELVRRLGEIDWQSDEDGLFSQINKVLWYMNFNSRSYMDFLIGYIRKKAKEAGSLKEEVKILYFYSKATKQMHQSRGAILNPDYHGLGYVLQKWLASEIAYKEEKIRLEVLAPEPVAKKAVNEKINNELKVLCDLSSDQIGLIIRAADELRVLVARSMTAVFRAIVPHLSSPHKDTLSYDGMRSKSYVAEEKDKQKAIETLERMIKKIRDY